MMERFKNLTDANKIAIVVPVGIVVIGGLFALFKWQFGKKDGPAPQEKTIHQKGTGHIATIEAAESAVQTKQIKDLVQKFELKATRKLEAAKPVGHFNPAVSQE